MKSYIIVDIDGTMANVEHRAEHAQAGDWEKFHSLCHLDEPYEDITRLINMLSSVFTIVALTGRNESNRPATEEWLRKHVPTVSRLLMRPNDDWRTDIEIKKAELIKLFGTEELVFSNVLCMIDDRDKLVAGLRDWGVTVLQPRNGDY